MLLLYSVFFFNDSIDIIVRYPCLKIMSVFHITLSRFQSYYDSTHFKYAMRILKYLYKTKHLKLTYRCNSNKDKLDCMIDSDVAGDNIDRKSTTGIVIRMYGNIIYWKTQKQKNVTKNSTFAEYIALSEATTEILFVINLFERRF